jgi:hypothetical protein
MADRISFGKNLAVTDFELEPLTDVFPLSGFSCA